MLTPIKTAILSVSDKAGICELGQHLQQLGVKMFSTGGTFRALREAEIKVTPIDELTQFPEIMDGRVKTLNPAVFAGLLARRANKKDMETLQAHQLITIDMVVVNLYPFQKVVAKPGAPEDEIIENIDIGGPSMLRAAAKNFQDVAAVVDPCDYGAIIEELLRNQGALTLETRRRLALKVFEHTSRYDTAIHQYFTQTTK